MEPAVAPHPNLPRYYGDEGKRRFVRKMFNDTAGDYDRVERMMAMGSGSFYRRRALFRAGLAKGMRVLDVAMGTGLVAREEITLTGDAKLVTGLDPSIGMITQARKQLAINAVLAQAEDIPLAGESFDFLSMGYAMRHLSDLTVAFKEFHRVLKPGGTVCILEIMCPPWGIRRLFLKAYMRVVVPVLSRFTTKHADTQLLWEYYWDTIESCVPVETVMASLKAAGFESPKHRKELGLFSEYVARKPK